ncbi:MAG: SpoIID/LytB domain-containing protein [Gordonia sp. (in: high G+C Gram-positive bacteria)]|uniref:SpoIID/LytB domain-containing protein n=1 Tax=Gordonia sp. (in: high G+C Gram-positive bacteria) TaxID=84139 RepID=UPI0039E4CA75
MPNTRPSRAKKRTATLAALGLAPALIAGGLVAEGTGLLDKAGISLTSETPITLIGHGHGHGRGLGQWGAYGYAKQGWSSDRILKHYYGNTTAGKVDNPEVTVSLSEKRGSSVSVLAPGGAKVGTETVAPGQAVSLNGTTASITTGCGGKQVKTVPNVTFVDPVTAGPGRPTGELLSMCNGGDKYRGSIGLGDGGVVNKLSVNDYVRGVIPKESLPAWADAGGFEALKAQAVAARSYVLAGLANGRKIDNTQNSQMYHGASGEDPRTNRAADATDNQVLLLNGKPALTEFSASTGGYTAGGLFPAVEDAGDAIAPTHDWTATVSPSQVAKAFGVNGLKSLDVIEANGLGAENGRALKVQATGKDGTTKVLTGDQTRVALQLKSDWFAVQGQKTPPKIVKPQVGASDGLGTGSGGDLLDLGPLTSLLSGDGMPDLSTLGISDLSNISDLTGLLNQLTPQLQQLIEQGTGAIGAKQTSWERSDNSNGSTGTVSRERSDNANGSTGTVSRERSDNSQGSTGTVAKPELVTDGKGVQGLVQVLQNGLIYWSPETGAHLLGGNALSDFLNKGGLAALGFPKADAPN